MSDISSTDWQAFFHVAPVNAVALVSSRTGWLCTNSFFGVTFPGDLDDHDREVDGQYIPNGMVELQFGYGDPHSEGILYPEKEFGKQVNRHFSKQ